LSFNYEWGHAATGIEFDVPQLAIVEVAIRRDLQAFVPVVESDHQKVAFDIAAPGLHHIVNDPVTRRRVVTVFGSSSREEMMLTAVPRILEVVLVTTEGNAHAWRLCFEETAQALRTAVARTRAIGRMM